MSNLFSSNFCETNSFLENMVSKLWEDERSTEVELRGKATPPNKTPDAKLEEIRKHISKFPAYESHYSRKHTSKKYLPTDLTDTKMYNLYKSEVDNPASLHIYRQVFGETGLTFKQPQIDTCHKCDLFAAKLRYEKDENRLRAIQDLQSAHHEAADLAYEHKSQDKKSAKQSKGSKKVGSFDLQQCLSTPALQTSVTFYKRPLWTYNLTINDNTTNKSKCYMWHEGLAKRGANEISSALYNYIDNLDPEVKHLILYSDSCAGQNKNKIVVAMMARVAACHPTLQILDHKFLEPGHTHMECDSDHAVIERAKKRLAADIHVPEDWYKLVREAKQENPFEVIELDQNMMYDFQELYRDVMIARKKDDEGEKFLMQKVKWLRFTEDRGIVYYKKSLSDEEAFSRLDLRRSKKFAFEWITLRQCYNGSLKITKEKKNDLMSLLPLLRPEVHQFYISLPALAIPTNFNHDPDIERLEQQDEPGPELEEELEPEVQNAPKPKKSKLQKGKKKLTPPRSNERRSSRISSQKKLDYREC